MIDRAEDIGYLLNRAVRLLRADLAARLRPYGLTPPQFAVMSEVMCSGAVTSAEVGRRLDLDRPTVSGIVERLERGGWLLRSQVAGDRRSHPLQPTERTKDVFPELATAAEASGERALGALGDDERRRLAEMLRRIADSFEPEAGR